MGYPKAEGLPELRERDRGLVRSPLRRRARSRRRGDPDLREQGGDLQLRAARPRPRRPEGHRRRHRARLPGSGARRGVRGRPRRVPAAARARTASSRTSTRWTDWDRIALFWVNYPNNPTGATAPLAFYERLAGLAARARLPRLLRRGVHRALVHRAAALGARACRPGERRRLPDALQALVDDRLPLRVRRLDARDRLGAQDLPALDGAAPQEFVQRASVAAWSDEAHVERTRDAYRAEARRAPAGARTEGLAGRCERGDDVPLGGGAGRRELGGRRRAPAAPRRRRRAGLLSRRGRRGLRPDRARPHARAVRAAAAILEEVL